MHLLFSNQFTPSKEEDACMKRAAEEYVLSDDQKAARLNLALLRRTLNN